MAEKKEIVNITINVDSAVDSSRKLGENLEILKKKAKESKVNHGELSNEYIKYTARVKVAQKELRTQNSITQNVIAANKSNTGSIDQMRKQLAITSVEWSKLNSAQIKGSKLGRKLTKEKKDLTKALKKEEAATGDARRNVGNYGDALGGAIPIIGRASGAVKALGRAFTVALGPLGLIVAAIALVVGGLKAFFTASEEGQDSWDEFGSTVSVVTDNIIDAMSDFGESLLEPKKLIDDIGDFFSKTFGDVLFGTLKIAANNIKKFFNNIDLQFQKFLDLFNDNSDEIDRAQKNIDQNNKDIAASNAQLISGLQATVDAYNDAADAVKDFTAEQLREKAISDALNVRRANLNRSIRNTLVSTARLRRDIAKIRAAAADKENKSAEERLRLLDEAIVKEKQILRNNQFIANEELSIAKGRASLSKDDRDAKDDLAKKTADVFNVQKATFEQLRKLESERQTALREIRTENQKGAKEAAQAEIDALIEVYETDKQLQADIDSINKQAAESRKEQKEQAKEQNQIETEAELEAAQDQIFRRLELERQGLEAQRILEIEFAESIGADTTAIEEKFSNAKKAISRAEQEAKLSLAVGFLGNLSQLAGEGTNIAKAAGVAETTISTIKGAQAAFSSLAGIPVVGPALGVVAAGAAVAMGVANVKKILSVDSGLPGGNGGGGSGGGSSVSTSGASFDTQAPGAIAPTLNQGIVSREALQNTNDNTVTVTPTLVVDDVTNAQNNETANNTTSVI